MGVASKPRDEGAAAEDGLVFEDESRQVSGLRERVNERETTPAPPDTGETGRSSRPTSIPDFDLAALAEHASLRHPTMKNITLDATVPLRTSKEPPDDLDLRLAFLLLHADGEASLGHIAIAVERPPRDVIASFVELSALGLVKLTVPR